MLRSIHFEQAVAVGIVPGLLGAFGLMLVAYIFARRYNLPTEEAFNIPRLRKTFLEALPAFSLPAMAFDQLETPRAMVAAAAVIRNVRLIMISSMSGYWEVFGAMRYGRAPRMDHVAGTKS